MKLNREEGELTFRNAKLDKWLVFEDEDFKSLESIYLAIGLLSDKDVVEILS